MNIVKILQSKFPNDEWSLVGEDYSGLVWISDSKKPTESELKKLSEEVELESSKNNNKVFRRLAYQENSDPIFFKYQAGEATKEQWLEERARVTQAFPYEN